MSGMTQHQYLCFQDKERQEHDWEDGSVDTLFAMQEWGPECNPQDPGKWAQRGGGTYNPSAETDESQALTSQPISSA